MPEARRACTSRATSRPTRGIRVVGVGGAGINAVNRMMDAGIAQVDFVAVNTDAQQLELDAPVKLCIGESITQASGRGPTR
jgi:cell division protein FtsZ